ncbi:site-specific integrase [Capnocytophaga sp.]|uniref:tyrosine-type recombinase/integrase n=1 Tax=Capnocytophaga sp. TaxID=44737 RepID=UPI0026DC30C2|nr:site-specific integrase [Capnocytophaga sp.]MDO5106425.1 tyrosine-type recombinase/integrase [Capnocytophaga sp.]
MKVNFILKGKNNPTNIICRFKPTQNNDFSCVTGLWVKREDWQATRQQMKQKATSTNKDLINTTLRELEVFILDKWTQDILAKKNIPKMWLKNCINLFFGRATENEQYKIYFTEWIQRFIDESPKRLYKGKPISQRTIQHYKTTLSKVQSFEKHTDTKLRHENINLEFYRNFVDYCRNVENLNNNSIGSYISHFKLWCKNIDLEGLPINPQYKHSEFMAVSNKTKDTYLNETEIDQIYNFDFGKSERLDNARDLFIIGLRTGLRISDFLRLKEINLNKGFIEIETVKTGEPVIIPLHPQIKAILEKRNGKLPYTISDQKFNLYIKEICKTVGINEPTEGAKMNPETKRKEIGIFPKYELISSHTCRRSFASNLYGKLPNMVIMAITGHQTEAVFLKYIKITKKEHAQTLARFWAKEQKEQGYETVLRVTKSNV